MKKIQTGFSLIELIVTLAVVAIAIAVGVPSLQRITESNRGASQNNLIMGSLTAARSEAIKRGVNVVMCNSANSTLGAPNCNSKDKNWEEGWIIFTDPDLSGDYSAGDTLLGVNGKLKGGLTLRAVDDADKEIDHITFKPDGGLVVNGAAASASFKVCPQDATLTRARGINIIPSGLITIAKDIDATPDSKVNIVNGSNITCP